MKKLIVSYSNEKVYDFISRHTDLCSKYTVVLSTTNVFNIDLLSDNFHTSIINLTRINDIRRINKFFEAVNAKLLPDGIFICCGETKNQRRKRILRKYLPVFNYIYFFFDFIFKRIIPKLPLTKKIYFALTNGKNRVLSRAEMLGRLYSCGFSIVAETFIRPYSYFVVKKVKEPAFDNSASYGPLYGMKRIGKNGKFIKVYKFRTMHPYSEYLQEYVYETNKLDEGGKFKDDFRITEMGRFFRKFWLDELPMIYNLIKGDLKLFGVRPLSEQYISLYTEELRERRQKYRPGLVPPYYVDMPKTIEEIMASEIKYFEAFDKKPFATDFNYFFKAMGNILFKRARSR
jgi:lipopolysaccharide/colanic/teichoic acid biosynthesis glycosyltransferase